MKEATFQRTKENFTCEHCGFFVEGNGYTNHCPLCLYCKHVDIYPGDRASLCEGMMEPFSWTREKQQFIIIHRCVQCGIIKRNKLAANDNMDIVIALKQKPV